MKYKKLVFGLRLILIKILPCNEAFVNVIASNNHVSEWNKLHAMPLNFPQNHVSIVGLFHQSVCFGICKLIEKGISTQNF